MLTSDVELKLNFGHMTSQPKFNQISTSYDIVCLLGKIIMTFDLAVNAIICQKNGNKHGIGAYLNFQLIDKVFILL